MDAVNDCEVGKLENMIKTIDDGGYVVNVFDVEKGILCP